MQLQVLVPLVFPVSVRAFRRPVTTPPSEVARFVVLLGDVRYGFRHCHLRHGHHCLIEEWE